MKGSYLGFGSLGFPLDEDVPTKHKDRKRIEDYYEYEEELGKGGFGVVYKARNKETGGYNAIKVIDKGKAGASGMAEVFSEVEIISLLQHRYIIKVTDVFDTKDALYIVMELLCGGELQQRLRKVKNLAEPTVKRFVRNMLLAVEYIHRRGIVHRDLKPANMLLTSDHEQSEVKIADFGFAVLIGNDSCLQTSCGTTAFMAPEILSGQPYGKSVDMWSIGVIVYNLISGEMPFTGCTNDELISRITSGNYVIPESGIWATITPGVKDMIRRLLVVDPKRRSTALECLNHPWVKTGAEEDMDLIMQLNMDDPMKDEFSSLHERKMNKAKKVFLVVIACHRLIFFAKVNSLKRGGVTLPLLLKFHTILRKCFDHSVKDVDCSVYNVGNKGLPALLDIVNSSHGVETLLLPNNDLNYDSVQLVVKTASTHSSLTHLDLSGNPITQTGGRALLRLTRGNPRIKVMGLRGTQMNAELLQQIAQAVKDNEKKKVHSQVSSSSKSELKSLPLPSVNGLRSPTPTLITTMHTSLPSVPKSKKMTK